MNIKSYSLIYKGNQEIQINGKQFGIKYLIELITI